MKTGRFAGGFIGAGIVSESWINERALKKSRTVWVDAADGLIVNSHKPIWSSFQALNSFLVVRSTKFA